MMSLQRGGTSDEEKASPDEIQAAASSAAQSEMRARGVYSGVSQFRQIEGCGPPSMRHNHHVRPLLDIAGDVFGVRRELPMVADCLT
jgi:hypothetical protein